MFCGIMIQRLLFFGLYLAFIACQSGDDRNTKIPLNGELFAKGAPIATLETLELQEASGLAVSKNNPGHLWSHNDSGDSAKLYLLSTAGDIKMTASFDGIIANDWEEMSLFQKEGQSFLLIGDIGDNQGVRSSITLLLIKEPVFSGVEKIVIPQDSIGMMTLQYTEGARDAESFFYDPLDDQIVLITKREENVLVYEFAFQTSALPVTIQSKGSLPLRNFTSADVLPQGDILIKNYESIFYWKRNSESALETLLENQPVRVPYIVEPQGEALSVDSEGNFYTLSEKNKYTMQVLYFYEKLD